MLMRLLSKVFMPWATTELAKDILWAMFLAKIQQGVDRPYVTKAEAMEMRASGQFRGLHLIDDPLTFEGLTVAPSERLMGSSYTRVYDGGIASILIDGPVYRRATAMDADSGVISTEMIARDVAMCRKSANVNAIILEADCPGGEATAGDECAQLIYETRGIKPIETYAEGLCASLMYYYAAATSKITASQMAMLGSIGVVMGVPVPVGKTKQGDNVVDFGHGKMGVEFVSSCSPMKRVDPTTKEGHEYYINLVNEAADVFVTDAARFRGLEKEKLPSQYGDGGLSSGRSALKMGLCDEVGSFASLLERMQSDYGKASPSKVVVGSAKESDETTTEGTGAIDSDPDGGEEMGLLDKIVAAVTQTPRGQAPANPAQPPTLPTKEVLAALEAQRPALEARYEDSAASKALLLVTGSKVSPKLQHAVAYRFQTAMVDDALFGGTVLFARRNATSGELEEVEGTRVQQLEAEYAETDAHSLATRGVRALQAGEIPDAYALAPGRTEQASGVKVAGDNGVEAHKDDELLGMSVGGERAISARTQQNNGNAATR